MSNAAETGYAIVYVRCSKDEQTKGDSIPRQNALAEQRAAELGLTIQARYADEGVPSFRGQNFRTGKLGELFEAARLGKFPENAYLLVESEDRLSRKGTNSFFKIWFALLGFGLKICLTAKGEVATPDDDDPTGVIMRAIGSSKGHIESRDKSGRILTAMQAKRDAARSGTAKFSGNAPGWFIPVYDNPPGTKHRKVISFDLHTERVAIVQRIFKMSASGVGEHSIARLLNDDQILSFGATPWHRQSVRNILESRAVLGEYQPGIWRTEITATGKERGFSEPEGEPILDYFPRVISDAEWQAVKTIKARNKNSGGKKGKLFTNLFSGLLRCGECGGVVSYHKYRLRCMRAYRHAGCQNHEPIWYKTVEAALLDKIIDLLVSAKDAIEISSERQEIVNQIALLERQIDDKRRLLAGYVKRFESDPEAFPAVLLKGMTDAENVVDSLNATLSEAQQRLAIETGKVGPGEALAGIAALRDRAKSLDPSVAYLARAEIAGSLKDVLRLAIYQNDGSIYLQAGENENLRINIASDGRITVIGTGWQKLDQKMLQNVTKLSGSKWLGKFDLRKSE